MIGSAGVTLGDTAGWFSALRWRYISQRPLTEDGTFQSPAMNIVNGSIGYQFDNGWRIQLDALNLLNSATDQVTYAYGGLLTSDALFARCYPVQKVAAAVCGNGVMDYSFHPMEPLAFRLTLAGPLETIGTLNIRKMAAEMKRSFPAEPLHAGDYDWTGFYVGVHLGTVWSSTNGSTVNTATGAMSAPLFVGSAADWNGGIQVGYDYMMPNRVVVGFEADVSSGGSKTTKVTDASGTSANQTRVFDTEIRPRPLGLFVRQCPAVWDRRLGVVERPIHPHAADWHAQPRDRGHR